MSEWTKSTAEEARDHFAVEPAPVHDEMGWATEHYLFTAIARIDELDAEIERLLRLGIYDHLSESPDTYFCEDELNRQVTESSQSMQERCAAVLQERIDILEKRRAKADISYDSDFARSIAVLERMLPLLRALSLDEPPPGPSAEASARAEGGA